jgi:hypothetical protein
MVIANTAAASNATKGACSLKAFFAVSSRLIPLLDVFIRNHSPFAMDISL